LNRTSEVEINSIKKTWHVFENFNFHGENAHLYIAIYFASFVFFIVSLHRDAVICHQSPNVVSNDSRLLAINI
jgi:hypothetical protein